MGSLCLRSFTEAEQHPSLTLRFDVFDLQGCWSRRTLHRLFLV